MVLRKLINLGPVRGENFLKLAWNHKLIWFARSVISDLFLCAMILLSLEAIWWLLKQIEFMGYPAERLAYFEKVHFCSSLSAFILVSTGFVIKFAIGLYREKG